MTIRKAARAAALLASTTLLSPAAFADAPAVPAQQTGQTLDQQFQDPPMEARPRVWWHWMNGNISKDGIAKDLAWMKRVGIGGLQNFDANLQTPQVVPNRLIYMTPEWKEAFRFAASEADRLGLELAIAASPGWSETGGPWVKPQDGLKKLVWSETVVEGGKRFSGTLSAPPSSTGPFQSMGKQPGIDELLGLEKPGPLPPKYYADIAVLAYPAAGNAASLQPGIRDADGQAVDASGFEDGDLSSSVRLTAPKGKPVVLTYDYGRPQTLRSASLLMLDSANPFGGTAIVPRLESSVDGQTWNRVAVLAPGAVPTTVSFAPTTARWFRVVFMPFSFGGLNALWRPAPGSAEGPWAALASAEAKPTEVKIGDLRLSALPRIDRFEAKAGFSVQPDYYGLSNALPDDPGVPAGKVVDLTRMVGPDGKLNWTPPKGSWKIVRFGYSLIGTTNHPAPPEATGLEVDKFDGEAVGRYLDHYIGMYKDASGGLIGSRGVRALLTDSIEVGASNWTPRLVAQFRRLRGYDPMPWLPALTGEIVGSRAQSDKFLYDFRRTLADLMASEHYGTVARIAHDNGLKVYGEALESGRPSLGDDMAMRAHADIPMSALWTFSREQGPQPPHIADMKGAASVAHIYGQNLVAAESMTAALHPWAYAPVDLKRIIDVEFVTGVNRPVIHTSVHVPVDDKKPGLSLFIFGQYFNRNESWAEMARPWVDYLSRNALLLQQGRNVADVAYFYGEEGPLTALYADKPVADAPRGNAYDFVNFDALASALTNEGNELVTPGGARYRALYLGGSSRRMTLSALRRIAALAEGGATIVGTKPEGSPSLAGDAAEYAALANRLWAGGAVTGVGKGQVVASADIDAALRQIGVAPDFRFSGGQDGAEIPFVHRRFDGGESYFLVNRKARSETIEARFRVTGKAPELWHAETGKSEAVSYRIENGETVIALTLEPEESVHVVFRKAAVADSLMIKKIAPTAVATLDKPWKVSFEAGRGAPAFIALPKLGSLTEQADPGVKYFSGVASYSSSFTLPKWVTPGAPLWLNLGDVGDLAEVIVNGRHAGYAWHKPYRVDISGAVRKGSNVVEIKVANLWVNRLIGDAQPGAAKVTWTAQPTYSADAPLRPSGLIGPVVLEAAGGRAR